MSRPGGGPGAGAMMAGVILLGGCAPVVMPIAPAEAQPPAIGPTLVLDVVNASADEIPIAYEFESVNAGGGGEGSVPGCERIVMEFGGGVAGSYEITVAGSTVVDGPVPPGLPARGYLIARVMVEADGSATLDGAPRWIANAPPFTNAPIADCG